MTGNLSTDLPSPVFLLFDQDWESKAISKGKTAKTSPLPSNICFLSFLVSIIHIGCKKKEMINM